MPYRCALYRGLARCPDVEWTVLFLDRWGYEQRYDPTMNATYSWGDEVLSGFEYKFLANKGRFAVTYTGADRTVEEQRQGLLGGLRFYLRTYFGLFTPEVVGEIWASDARIVIVENYSSVSSVLAAIVSRLRGKKVFLRGEATLRTDQSTFFRIAKRVYLRALFPIYSGFMYSCTSNKSFYRSYGVPEEKMVFVPSAVDEAFFVKLDQGKRTILGQERRRQYEIPTNSLVLLGVGRLVPRKNWEETIDSFVHARRKCRNLVLVIVGDGPSRSDLEKRVPEDVRESVHFLGFKTQSEIAEIYCMGDMLVQSSVYDPSPKVLNEALLAELPLLVSDRVGTAGDVCVDNYNGFIYRAGDHYDLSEKLVKISEDGELRKRFSAGSAELASKWSINRGVENIVKAVRGTVEQVAGTSEITEERYRHGG